MSMLKFVDIQEMNYANLVEKLDNRDNSDYYSKNLFYENNPIY